MNEKTGKLVQGPCSNSLSYLLHPTIQGPNHQNKRQIILVSKGVVFNIIMRNLRENDLVKYGLIG